jgi:hypothetical protein
MSKLNRMRSTGLALIALCLGLGFAGSASALEVGCGRSGCIGGGLDFDLHKSPNIQLSGTLTLQSRAPFGFGATLLGDLLQPMASQNACQASNGRSLCLSQRLLPNRAGHYAVRFHFTPDRTPPTRPTNAIPEPSAALIFGVGLLVASGLVMRTGELE